MVGIDLVGRGVGLRMIQDQESFGGGRKVLLEYYGEYGCGSCVGGDP